MWLFIEFFPELIPILKKTKDKANDPIIFYLFLLFLGIICLFAIIETSYIYGIFLITVFFLIVFNYKNLSKGVNSKNDLGISPIITTSLLKSHYQIIPIRYINIWSATKLVCDLSLKNKLYINFGNLGEETYIMINGKVIKTLPLSHLRIIFLGVIFQQYIIDCEKNKWVITIRIWGVFKARIIVKIKPKN